MRQVLTNLQCFKCGFRQTVRSSFVPKYVFEESQIAKDAGWISVEDRSRLRTLTFCSKQCKEACRSVWGYRANLNRRGET